MSQFCGSLLAFTSRCGVTSAAIAGAIAARPIDHMAASVVLRSMSSLQVLIFSVFSAAGAKRVATHLVMAGLVPARPDKSGTVPCPLPTLPPLLAGQAGAGTSPAATARAKLAEGTVAGDTAVFLFIYRSVG